MLRSKFFWRNLLSYAIVISFTTFVVSYLLTVKTEEFVREESRKDFTEKLNLLAPFLEQKENWNYDKLESIFAKASQDSGTRVTVIDSGGYVIYDSSLHYRELENHIDRPEIINAIRTGWGESTRYSESLNAPMLYVAKRIGNFNQLVLRFSIPMEALDKQLEEIRYVLGIGALVGMLVSLLLALFLAKRITRPIAAITSVAEAISRGNYNARLKYFPRNELGTLGHSINRLAEAVQANISKREKMQKIRKQFSSNASHELKTPLTSIKGYVETLQEGAIDDPATARRFLGIISSNIERITSLVTDLLNLATIEANQDMITLEKVHWDTIIQEVYARQEIHLQKKKIDFQINSDKNIPSVTGSRNAMTHILDNLLQNALNYTSEGGKISINLNQNDQQVLLSVKDTGIGISKKNQSRVFERFYRVDKARARDVGGTGLGLAIVKHLVIQIQGTIKVESELDVGSIFTVTLPIHGQ